MIRRILSKRGSQPWAKQIVGRCREFLSRHPDGCPLGPRAHRSVEPAPRRVLSRRGSESLHVAFLLRLNTDEKIWFYVGALLCVIIAVGIVAVHRPSCGSIINALGRSEQLQRQVDTSSRQRQGAVRAAEVERTRIERDVHDGIQPRLVSIGMTLGLAQRKLADDPQAAGELVKEAHVSTQAAITELRQLTRGIYASVLEDRGLDAALSALASRTHIPVHLDIRLSRPCGKHVEAAVYFTIAEALTNASKHSRATECRVIARTQEHHGTPTLWARVEDNGIGGARIVPGGGLDGVANRILAAGGTFDLDSPIGGPTVTEVRVPCES